jgi:glyoxylase-like metal-dependent hydrolase (beta-lactamase superfamily II)
VTALDELTTVVLAPNPGPMTLEGTNTYVLGQPGSGTVLVVDPGPELPEHRTAVEAAIGGREVAAVVLTHHHADHAEAAGWASVWGAPLRAFDPALVPGALPLGEGDEVTAGGVSIDPLHTPGHASDHLCLRIRETGVILTGDHVLGRGTTVVAWPDGDMGAYIASLERVAQLPASALYPGHGPVLPDPPRILRDYLEHRLDRERQVLDALRAGDERPDDIVRRVYADVDPALHPAAERSVQAHLAKLVDEGRVRAAGDSFRIDG